MTSREVMEIITTCVLTTSSILGMQLKVHALSLTKYWTLSTSYDVIIFHSKKIGSDENLVKTFSVKVVNGNVDSS